MQTCIYYKINKMIEEGIKPNFAAIAREQNCDYRTVKRYYKNGKQSTERKKRTIAKKLDGFEAIIEEKCITYQATAKSIFYFIKEKHGYTGSYSLVKTFVRSIKTKNKTEATVRFETQPGKQCQIDWKEEFKIEDKNGKIHTINIFLAILGFSRYKFIRLTADRSQETLFECLTEMFKYFGGVPKELLFDNMKTVVDHSRTQFGKPIYNQKLLSFATDAGFEAISCVAYRPQTKGKVETVARIVNRLKVYNNEFSTIDELNSIINDELERMNNEIQATINMMPSERMQKEKEYLSKEPNYDTLIDYYSTNRQITRKVPKDCIISFQNKKYSVSPKYIGKLVNIQTNDNKLLIYYNKNLIKSHEISSKSINYTEEDYRELLSTVCKNPKKIDELCKNNLALYDDIKS